MEFRDVEERPFRAAISQGEKTRALAQWFFQLLGFPPRYFTATPVG